MLCIKVTSNREITSHMRAVRMVSILISDPVRHQPPCAGFPAAIHACLSGAVMSISGMRKWWDRTVSKLMGTDRPGGAPRPGLAGELRCPWQQAAGACPNTQVCEFYHHWQRCSAVATCTCLCFDCAGSVQGSDLGFEGSGVSHVPSHRDVVEQGGLLSVSAAASDGGAA